MVHGSSKFQPPWPPTTPAIAEELGQLLAEQSWGVYEGERSARLQQRLCEVFAQTHAYLCSSGTLAVELALRGLGIGPGDEVLLSAYDFPGNFRAVEAVGGRPVLVDVGAVGWAFDADRVAEAVSPQTKAVIASHLHGSLVDMARLMTLAASLGLQVVEDTCQVPGASVGGRPAGSWGDVAVLSFGGSKLLSAGRGGAVLTRHPEVLQRIKIYAERGNLAFPLSELQAAVLLPQLDSLVDQHRYRLQAVTKLVAALQTLPTHLGLPTWGSEDSPAFYKFPILLGPDLDRSTVIRDGQRAGLPIDSGFRGFGRRSARRCRMVGELTHAMAAAQQTLLLHHPVLLQPGEVMDDLLERLSECLAPSRPREAE